MSKRSAFPILFWSGQDWTVLKETSQIPRPWRDYLFLVLLLGKIRGKFVKYSVLDGTNQYHWGNSWMVLKWTKIQDFSWNPVLDKKFLAQYLSSTEFWELKYKISILGIPDTFLGLRRDRKWPVLNGWDWVRNRKRMFPNARGEKFPGFFWKKFGTQKMRLGTQTSKMS